MMAKNRPRFDPDRLRLLAGERVFARGEAYWRDGLVEVLAVEPDRVLARVTGSDERPLSRSTPAVATRRRRAAVCWRVSGTI